MNRNNLWRFLIVILVVAWSFFELYPPKGRDLVQYFNEKAVLHDNTFSNIVVKARMLQQAMPDKAYDNLVEAVGTNDLNRYFPQFEAKTEANPNQYILNSLQRGAAGRRHAARFGVASARRRVRSRARWNPSGDPTLRHSPAFGERTSAATRPSGMSGRIASVNSISPVGPVPSSERSESKGRSPAPPVPKASLAGH